MSEETQRYGVKSGAHVMDGKLYQKGDVMELTRAGYERRKDTLEPAPEAREPKHSKVVGRGKARRRS